MLRPAWWPTQLREVRLGVLTLIGRHRLLPPPPEPAPAERRSPAPRPHAEGRPGARLSAAARRARGGARHRALARPGPRLAAARHPASGNPDLQPIWLTRRTSPVDDACATSSSSTAPKPPTSARWDRVFDLFDGDDRSRRCGAAPPTLEAATERSAGHALPRLLAADADAAGRRRPDRARLPRVSAPCSSAAPP
jgi:hypothetical protein